MAQDDHYPPGTIAGDLDAADPSDDPTWADFEYHEPALASKIDLEFIADWADHGDLGDLLTAIEARGTREILRIGDTIIRDRVGFRERKMRRTGCTDRHDGDY